MHGLLVAGLLLASDASSHLTAHVEDPSRLTQIHIGDTIVVTYTEALAVSLEKAEPKQDK